MTSKERFKHLTKAAQILDELGCEIEALGTRLSSDPAMAAKHVTDLQAIDLIAQKQRWIADLVRAECPVTAIEAISVEALQQRLRPAN
jgi:hypothetical protein